MGYVLHDYQIAAVNAALASIGAKRNDLIVAPTGSGKSVIIAGIVERLLASQKRILIISHVREILSVISDHLKHHIPGLDFGVYCAGLERFEPGKQVVVGSIQSLYRRSYGRGFDIILVDEAHRIPRYSRANTMYQQLFTFLRRAGVEGERERERKIPIIGLSATPYRLDSGYLHQGEDALFQRIAYEVPIPALIERGILAPLTTREVEEIDFSDLPIKAGEYQIDAFEEQKNWLAETARSLAIAKRLAASRRKWLIFACSVRHALAIAEMLNAEGVSAIAVHHRMPKQERDEAVRSFQEGETRAIVNVEILTTGFNAPRIDCVLMIRPTLSTGLFVQKLGRAMRSFPGKEDALVLDFSGNIRRHGPMTNIFPRILGRFSFDHNRPRKQAQTKYCPTCATELASFARQCQECGRLFITIEREPENSDPLYPSPILDHEDAPKSILAREAMTASPQSPRKDKGARRTEGGWNWRLGRLDPEDRAILDNADNNAESEPATDLRDKRQPTFIYRKTNIWYYLREVPKALKPKFGFSQWQFSLRTNDKARALKVAARIANRHDRLIAATSPGRQAIPPSAWPYLSTEEVAALIGITPRYLNQMRHYKTGPRFYSGGGLTTLGWRMIVYRMEDVERWQSRRSHHVRGKDGRTWRLATAHFAPIADRPAAVAELHREIRHQDNTHTATAAEPQDNADVGSE